MHVIGVTISLCPDYVLTDKINHFVNQKETLRGYSTPLKLRLRDWECDTIKKLDTQEQDILPDFSVFKSNKVLLCLQLKLEPRNVKYSKMFW